MDDPSGHSEQTDGQQAKGTEKSSLERPETKSDKEVESEPLPSAKNYQHLSRKACQESQISDPYEIGWRRVVRNFTPSWFSVIMGTGIVSILLYKLPYNSEWIYWLSVIVFVLNISLFFLFLSITILRYALWPEIWKAMISHPTQSLFLGTFPMGLATIITMIVYVCVPAWGPWTTMLAWALWWIDTVISVSTCFYLPFKIMCLHDTQLSTMTATWLLPIVPTVVAAATGATVAEVLPNPEHALWTIIVSYILWGIGVPLSLFVLVMYFQRLTVYKLPPREVIVSCFLPLGPLGQGSFGIMQLGRVAQTTFPQTKSLSPMAGEILYVLGFATALVLWGFALIWFCFALDSVSRSRFPFNMGWWGFTFPIGVFTTACTTFGNELHSTFFRVIGTILSLAVILLWAMVAIGTIKRSYTGAMFTAPCLGNLETTARVQKRKEDEHAV